MTYDASYIQQEELHRTQIVFRQLGSSATIFHRRLKFVARSAKSECFS